MIQRSGISWAWQGCTSVLALIAITGCGERSTVTTPANGTAPVVVEDSEPETDAESTIAENPVERATETASPVEVAERRQASVSAEKPKETPSEPVASPPSPSAMKKPKVALSVPDPPEYVFEPQVLMSQQHTDMCLVKAGEPFPDGLLSDLAGQEHSLKELLGEKLTVVVFWADANRLGREQVQRLDAEIVAPFENSGLNVVAINVGDSEEQIRDLLPADRKVGFTILLDPDTALFSKVAVQRLPRTYLLDAKGNILWFDVEYSRSAVRELVNAIHVHLGNHKFGDSHC
ncbi:MAG: redoxin domain-containing protein [Planctomycetia bacterium]|nr:redoxin domain-containing protein [Planctomycetia bacterium]